MGVQGRDLKSSAIVEVYSVNKDTGNHAMITHSPTGTITHPACPSYTPKASVSEIAGNLSREIQIGKHSQKIHERETY